MGINNDDSTEDVDLSYFIGTTVGELLEQEQQKNEEQSEEELSLRINNYDLGG